MVLGVTTGFLGLLLVINNINESEKRYDPGPSQINYEQTLKQKIKECKAKAVYYKVCDEYGNFNKELNDEIIEARAKEEAERIASGIKRQNFYIMFEHTYSWHSFDMGNIQANGHRIATVKYSVRNYMNSGSSMPYEEKYKIDNKSCKVIRQMGSFYD